jgi:hypothetical protein
MAANRRATSATWRAMGPTVSNCALRPTLLPRMEIAPCVGLRPQTPFTAAGVRTEPPVSEPSAAAQRSAASAAPAPPDEPLGMRSRDQGFFTRPVHRFCEVEPKQSSCRLVLPRITAPARRQRATTSASSFGT